MSRITQNTMRQIGVIGVLVIAAPAYAGSISVEWDPVSHEGLTGYRIYWGQAPGNYTSHIDLGTQPNVTLFGLATCTDYHLAVKARTNAGLVSIDFSNEVSGWARPELTSVVPSAVPRDTMLTLTIQGDSFMPGAQVLFVDPAIAVLSTRVDACGQLSADVSIGAGASLGSTAFEVVNPDGVFGYASALLEIEENTEDGLPTITNLAVSGVGDTIASVTWTTDEPGDGRVSIRESGTLDYATWIEGDGLVTEHRVDLHGLRPDTTYDVRVRSESAQGEGTTSPDVSFSTLPNDFNYRRFEAEAGSPAAPLVVDDADDAFGGQLLLAPGSGFHDLDVYIPQSGDGNSWHVWLRTRGNGTDSSGWTVAVDGVTPADVDNTLLGSWEWRHAGSWAFATGFRTVAMTGFGTGARLDRVLLTDDPAFVPSERPTSDTAPPDPVSGLVVEPGNGRVTLTWTSPANSDLRRIVIRYRDDGRAPETPADGYRAAAVNAVPGLTQGVTHSGVANGVLLHYSVFAVDVAENASIPVSAQATPEAPQQAEPLDPVDGIHRTDTR